MKIRVDASLLRSAVTTAVEALSARPAKNEWNCVHLQTSDESGLESVKITCQDFGICVTTSIPCEIEESGSALIPAKLFQQYVALMSGSLAIAFDPNSYRTELKCGGKKSLISGFDPCDFIISLRAGNLDGMAVISGDAFAELVGGSSFCCSVDQSQMVLTGTHILFSDNPQGAECCATDGYRLAIKRSQADVASGGEINIPASVAQKIVSIMGKSSDIRFSFGNGVCIAETEKAKIIFALLSGSYVDYRRLLFDTTDSRAKISVPAFLNAVKFANIAAMSGKTHAIMLHFDSDAVTISAAATDNDSVTRVDCEYIGMPMKICFNGRYVQAALEKLDRACDEATLLLRSPVAPMALIPIGSQSKETYYLVLPARTVGG